MKRKHLFRLIVSLLILLTIAVIPVSQPANPVVSPQKVETKLDQPSTSQLQTLEVKGRAPKTGYTRTQFGDGWDVVNGCDMRNTILARDLLNIQQDSGCRVLSGELHDPYTGTQLSFVRGASTSSEVQIDHIVSLSNAWQTGAQLMTKTQRQQFANDPLELIAVDGTSNQQKSDGDAATWLPRNKSFRCTYVNLQIAVKAKYRLWVTQSEKAAMEQVLTTC